MTPPDDDVEHHRRRGWLQRSLFAALLIAAACMRVDDTRTVTLFSNDEANYARLTDIVLTQGSAGLQAEAARFRAQPSPFDGPSPMRAGYLYAMAGLMRVTGWQGIRAIALGSALLDAVSLGLVGVLAWTRMGPGRALAAMLLYSVSPPVLAMARRAWQEPLVVCLGLLVMLTGLKCVETRGRGWAVTMGALAGFTFTIKETAFIEACLLVVLAGVALARQREWTTLSWLGASFLVALGAAWLWLGQLLGGVAQVMYFLTANVRIAAQTPYAVKYQSGTAMDWLTMVWRGDPFLTLLAGLGVVAATAAWRLGRQPGRLVVWSIAIAAMFLVLPVLSANRLNLRFAGPALAAMCWLGAEALFAGDRLLRRSLTPRGATIAPLSMAIYLGVIAVAGVAQFRTTFEARAMVDLSSGLVLARDP